MKLNIKQIIEGWKNDIFPEKEMREIIRQTQEERLAICLTCPFNSSEERITNFSYCKNCGCPLKKKSACLSCECPEKKWLAVATKEENDNINIQLNQENEPS